MASELERLAAEAANCTRCRLHETRTQVVFGEGNPDADVMFVGEAPGYHEDKQGRPFVGPSGQLLNRLLAGIGLRREDVYICNVLKSRPPRNRDPLPDEIAACRYWLDAQIRLVDPKVVVTLGNFAAKTLLDTTTGITRLRGRAYPFQGRLLLPTFHPAAALHAGSRGFGPNPLEGMEEDLRLLAKLLAEQRPAGAEPGPDAGGGPGPARPAAEPGPPGPGREVPPGEPPGSEQLGLF
jgi:DNA polymerase